MTVTLGQRIREARKGVHLSADELAFATGMTVRTIMRYEAGDTTPTVGKLRLIAATTRKPLAYFMEAFV